MEIFMANTKKEEFDIQKYMTNGVKRVVNDAVRATLSNPKESVFMAKFALASKKASDHRRKMEDQGEHIPPFLISSITSSCNLHCAGCYSRSNHACSDEAPVDQLTGDQWGSIFTEADELGISFILLAGGEPLLRWDVMQEATKHENIMFPIFTNGFFIKDKYLELFDKHRNMIPIISIEGDKEKTDLRRGEGVYDKVMQSMNALHDNGLIFGTSVTVTTQNLDEVYSEEFISGMSKLGCKAVIFVEFVPVTDDSTELAPGEDERIIMAENIARLRKDHPEMVFIAFPGDEKSSGGCVAAGRGFFHINSHGGAEPCPFSPYSDTNVAQTSLRQALKSPLFYHVQDQGLLIDDHAGGCTLFANRDKVESILNRELPSA
jgi:MoaA/NifB/PqqE/SkfB family radical SAM enzyme